MGLRNSGAGADLENLALNHQNSLQTNDSHTYTKNKTGDNLMVSLIYLFRSPLNVMRTPAALS